MDDQKLRSIFKFDEVDLQADRNGYLSEKQKSNILKRINYFTKNGKKYALGVIVISLGIVAMDWGISSVQHAPHPNSSVFIVAGVFLLLGFLMLLLLTSESGSTYLSNDAVKKVEGPANIIKAERTRTSGGKRATSSLEHYFVYELHIGDKAFDVDESLSNVIMQKDEYAVYYDDLNGKILSAEFVSKAK